MITLDGLSFTTANLGQSSSRRDEMFIESRLKKTLPSLGLVASINISPLCGEATSLSLIALAIFFKQSLLSALGWRLRQVLNLQAVIVVTILTT